MGIYTFYNFQNICRQLGAFYYIYTLLGLFFWNKYFDGAQQFNVYTWESETELDIQKNEHAACE